MANVFGSTTIVATTNAATTNPMIRTIEGNPSRYITKKNAKYTKARPVSLCRIVSAAGSSTRPAAISCERVLLKLVSCLERYFAKESATQILQNSAG